MTCARCGDGIYQAEDQIVMTKQWHKRCFRCCNCNTVLRASSAKFFQGELFCERCHGLVLFELVHFESSPKCGLQKATSLPRCMCTDDETNNKSKKESSGKLIGEEPQKSTIEKTKSSSLPDLTKIKSYSSEFPLPREVANYLNRNMRKKMIYEPRKPYLFEEIPCPARVVERRPRIIVRTLSPTRRKCSPRNYRVTGSEDACTCCFARQHSPVPVCVKCDGYPEPHCCCTKGRKHSSRRRSHSSSKRNVACNCHFEPQYHHRFCQKSRPKKDTFNNTDNGDQNNCICLCDGSAIYVKPSDNAAECCEHFCPMYRDFSEQAEEYRDKETDLQCLCCPIHDRKHYNHSDSDRVNKHCFCGNVKPCCCKYNQVREECTSICVRCNRKVYAAEKIYISSGPFHTSCFSCYCCHKLLDVKRVYEHKGEIYCKNCYNNFVGNEYYGYGPSQCC